MPFFTIDNDHKKICNRSLLNGQQCVNTFGIVFRHQLGITDHWQNRPQILCFSVIVRNRIDLFWDCWTLSPKKYCGKGWRLRFIRGRRTHPFRPLAITELWLNLTLLFWSMQFPSPDKLSAYMYRLARPRHCTLRRAFTVHCILPISYIEAQSRNIWALLVAHTPGKQRYCCVLLARTWSWL
jgi:hypothetical protein